MKSLFALLVLPISAAAAGPCENYAKFGAIRAYKAESGTIQGSDPSWNAKYVRSSGDISEYLVTIADQNEDNETWEVDYSVKVRGKTPRCSLVSVKKVATR